MFWVQLHRWDSRHTRLQGCIFGALTELNRGPSNSAAQQLSSNQWVIEAHRRSVKTQPLTANNSQFAVFAGDHLGEMSNVWVRLIVYWVWERLTGLCCYSKLSANYSPIRSPLLYWKLLSNAPMYALPRMYLIKQCKSAYNVLMWRAIWHHSWDSETLTAHNLDKILQLSLFTVRQCNVLTTEIESDSFIHALTLIQPFYGWEEAWSCLQASLTLPLQHCWTLCALHLWHRFALVNVKTWGRWRVVHCCHYSVR